jgi:protein TonB
MTVRGAMVFGALSVLAHLGGAMMLSEPDAIEIAGTAPAAARLGNSFADVAVGSAVSVPGPATAAPAPPAAAPDPVPDAALMPVAPPPETVAAALPPPLAPTAAAALPLPRAPAPAAESVSPPPSVAAAVAVEGPSELVETLPAVPPATLLSPPPAALAPAPPLATVSAAEPGTSMNTSPRPRPRPWPETATRADPPSEPAPKLKAKAKPEPASGAAAGAAEAERKGVAEGTEKGSSEEVAGKTASTDEGGNAAASNYPGTVMRKISRTKKPKVGAQGTAVVGFEIAASGDLAGVRLLRSSGEPAIDAAAMDHLRRAAPFPAPPAGAQRRFQITYESRG